MPRLDLGMARQAKAGDVAPRSTAWAAGVVLVLSLPVLAGCNRITLLRPDTSRKGFESTAHEVEITDNGRSRSGGATARVQIAQQSLATGDLAAAEREARQALKVDPKSAGAYTVLALVQDRKGDATNSGKYYKRAAELAPTQGGMLNNYGIWLCSQGRAVESLAWFDQALASPGYQTPEVAAANAGACALQAGQSTRAEASLRQALALDPQNPLALASMAQLEFKAGRAMAARAFSQRRLAAAPSDPASLLIASQIEYKLGDSRAAEEYVRRLKAEFPDAGGFEKGENGK